MIEVQISEDLEAAEPDLALAERSVALSLLLGRAAERALQTAAGGASTAAAPQRSSARSAGHPERPREAREVKGSARLADGDLTIVLSDDAHLQALNRQFLGIDAPTDVLSFTGGDADPETGVDYLGDVIISYPRARLQASAGGHPLEEELQLLVVHGVLHLLGYDHADEQQKDEMWAVQAQVLESLGCSLRP